MQLDRPRVLGQNGAMNAAQSWTLLGIIGSLTAGMLSMVGFSFANLRDHMDAKFQAVTEQFKAVDQRFNAVDQRFNAVDQRFNAVDARLDRVEQRLDSLDRDVKTLFRDGH